VFRGCFPLSSQLVCRARPSCDGPGTHEPGRRFPAVARPAASAHKCAARIRPLPRTSGSPVNGRHAHFEALLPPGVRSDDDLALARLGPSRRCSPGVLHPPEPTPPRFRVRSLADPHAGGSRPSSTHVSRCPVTAVAFPRPRLRPRAREPRIRRYAPSIEPRVPPSGSDPAHQAPRERFRAPAASPVLRALPGVFRTERLARAPSRRHPAPPCPLRRIPSARRVHAAGPRRRDC